MNMAKIGIIFFSLLLAACVATPTREVASVKPGPGTVAFSGKDAKVLYDLAAGSYDSPQDQPGPDKVDFLGTCIFHLQRETIRLKYCECSIGRLDQMDDVIQIVRPHLALAPNSEFSDEESGIEARQLGIEYSCERDPARKLYRCVLRDHFYVPRESRPSRH